VTRGGRYVVAQEPPGGAWRHYLSGWVRGGTRIRTGVYDARDVPVFLPSRDQASAFDEQTACQVAARLDDRYRRVVRHVVEELP
jgi:hypothetical protein